MRYAPEKGPLAMHRDRPSDADRLTVWQGARERRRALTDRVMGVLFGLLALAAVLYVLALVDLVRPAL